MNEVGNTSASHALGSTASSKGGVDGIAEAGGKKLPQVPDETKAEQAKLPNTPEQEVDVEQAVASINDFVQSVQRNLQFTVDEELNRTIIKVVDSSSGELIRQIPEETFLELARKLNDGGGIQLIDALG